MAVLVSIIIPVYKAEDCISRCLDSVISQSFPDWECILVDDGSPDNSGKICDDYAAKDSRIRVIHQKNAGASAARNTGMDIANGQYICFADADDYIKPEYISSMLEEREEDVDLILQGITHIHGDRTDLLGFKNKQTFALDSTCDFFDNYSLFRFCGSYSKLFKRDIIEKYDIRYSTEIICAEDYDLLLRYLVHCDKMKVLTCCNYVYISNEGSVSTRMYSFEKEYSGLCQIANSMGEFAKKVNNEGLTKQQQYLVTYYTQRVLFANYKNNYDRSQRLSNFKKIDKHYLDYFGEYHKPETSFLALVKILYSNRCFRVLDFIMKKAV